MHAPSPAPKGKRPLLILLHGLGGSGASIERNPTFVRIAQRGQFFWVAPNGEMDSHGRRFWNASDACCNFDHAQVDHVAKLRRLIDQSLKRYPIDPDKVFVVGFSNGGFMAHRLACELADRIRGIVSIAGAGPKADQTCTPSKAVAVLQIHGDADAVVPFQGGPLFGKPGLAPAPSALETTQAWARRNGCSQTPAAAATLDLEPQLPGRETQVLRFSGCQGAAVELWRVRGGSHFVASQAPAAEALWRFIREQLET